MPKKWSKRVSEKSNALDLEKDVFKSGNPKDIAKSLASSAEHYVHVELRKLYGRDVKGT